MMKKDRTGKFPNVRDCACFNLRAAARSLSRAYDEALRPVDLKVTQFTILAAIDQAGDSMPIGHLAKALSMDRTTLTRNLMPLERRGLVEVLPEGYRRSRGMALTQQGERILAQALPLWRQVQIETVDRLGEKRWSALRGEIATLTGKA